MSITAAYVAEQGADKTKFLLRDATDYNNVEPRSSFLSRQFIIYKSDGSVFRPEGATSDTVDFDYDTYPDDVIEISGLDKDYAFLVLMTITPSAPQIGSVYVANQKFALTGYASTAFLDRMKRQSVQPVLEQDARFVLDTHRILMELENAQRAAAAGDTASAQLSLNRAKYIINNKLPY